MKTCGTSDILKKQVIYNLLYKFLKQKKILNNYLFNCAYVGSKKHSNAKEMLKKQIDEWYKDNEWREDCTSFSVISNVFSTSTFTFCWDESLEGFEYWDGMCDKWYKFLKKHLDTNKKKYENLWNIGYAWSI